MDIGVGPFSITPARYAVIDFTTSYHEEPTVILTPAPTETPKFFACARPFQMRVWMCLLTVICLLPLVIWIYLRFRQRVRMNQKRARTSLKSSYLLVFRILLAQCTITSLYDKTPRKINPRKWLQ